jgi:hypothetical protein
LVDGQGTCFVIRLLARGAGHLPGDVTAVEAPHEPVPVAQTVLVVDDEPAIGKVLGEMLRKWAIASK